MAFDKGDTHTFNCSTGIPQYSGVSLSTAGLLTLPTTVSGRVLGVVLSSGTTGSTSQAFQSVKLFGPVAKVRVSTASTGIAIGHFVGMSTKGTVTPTSAGDYTVGQSIENVGSTGTVVSVILAPWGTT